MAKERERERERERVRESEIERERERLLGRCGVRLSKGLLLAIRKEVFLIPTNLSSLSEPL